MQCLGQADGEQCEQCEQCSVEMSLKAEPSVAGAVGEEAAGQWAGPVQS